MSILRVDSIRNNGSGFNDVVTFANSDGTENGTLCRAWVNFNGVGVIVVRADFNVNTVDDGGVGYYTVNFSNALVDGSFAAAGGFNNVNILAGGRIFNRTATSVSMRNSAASNAAVDADDLSICVFR